VCLPRPRFSRHVGGGGVLGVGLGMTQGLGGHPSACSGEGKVSVWPFEARCSDGLEVKFLRGGFQLSQPPFDTLQICSRTQLLQNCLAGLKILPGLSKVLLLQ
jgi:hypothetical protein